jgi:hypothetical protein
MNLLPLLNRHEVALEMAAFRVSQVLRNTSSAARFKQ